MLRPSVVITNAVTLVTCSSSVPDHAPDPAWRSHALWRTSAPFRMTEGLLDRSSTYSDGDYDDVKHLSKHTNHTKNSRMSNGNFIGANEGTFNPVLVEGIEEKDDENSGSDMTVSDGSAVENKKWLKKKHSQLSRFIKKKSSNMRLFAFQVHNLEHAEKAFQHAFNIPDDVPDTKEFQEIMRVDVRHEIGMVYQAKQHGFDDLVTIVIGDSNIVMPFFIKNGGQKNWHLDNNRHDENQLASIMEPPQGNRKSSNASSTASDGDHTTTLVWINDELRQNRDSFAKKWFDRYYPMPIHEEVGEDGIIDDFNSREIYVDIKGSTVYKASFNEHTVDVQDMEKSSIHIVVAKPDYIENIYNTHGGEERWHIEKEEGMRGDKDKFWGLVEKDETYYKSMAKLHAKEMCRWYHELDHINDVLIDVVDLRKDRTIKNKELQDFVFDVKEDHEEVEYWTRVIVGHPDQVDEQLDSKVYGREPHKNWDIIQGGAFTTLYAKEALIVRNDLKSC